MTNTISQLPSPYYYANTRTAGTTGQTGSSATSQTSELLSSFKEIMSTMMLSNSLSSTSSTSSLLGGDSSLGSLGGLTGGGSDMSGMMSSLMMLILLEKIVDSQALSPTAANTSSSTALTGKNEPSGRPVAGPITQYYHPGHNGLDFGVVVGTEIKSTMDGKVTYAGWNDQGYGNLVIVENGSYKTYYAHLSSIPVSVGDTVGAGSVVGLSGNTGHSTGPHLHYEIRKDNVPIDPTSVTLGAEA